MAHAASASLVHQLGSLFAVGSTAGLSDRELLGRFIADRDPAGQAAFATLVARHGPMVLGLCRQLLGDHHHAEDTFQAVFLVLARQARSIRDPDLLGNWLYGVALRTARKAHGRLDRLRRAEEEGANRRPEARPAEQPGRMLEREQAEALHAEIDRLPDSFRLPVVLCYLEGLSPDEAARRLRWPGGTVRSRLVRARDKLRRELIRRGFAPALAPRVSVSPLLCNSTTRAAIAFAARQAAGGASWAPAAALAHEVLQTMLITQFRTAALSVLVLATLAAGALSFSHDAPARSRAGEPNVKTAAREGEPRAQTARAEPRPPGNAPPDRGRMTVAGRVLGPDGRSAAGVPVEFIGRRREPAVALKESWSRYILLGRGRTGADGRFRIEAERTASDSFLQLHAIAAAPGVGLGWGAPDPDAERPEVEISLRPEQLIRGKLTDLIGRPAAGVEIGVSSIDRIGPDGRGDWIGAERPAGMLNWPRPVKTDDRGRFTIKGVGREMTAHLRIRDPRFAPQGLAARADGSAGSTELTRALQPATTVEGRVLAADTGLPIPRAIVSLGSSMTPFFSGAGPHFPADDRGRFTARAAPGEYYSIRGYPPEGSPYLISEHRFNWTKGTVTMPMDVTVPRGVLIRGRVVEAGTGRPLAGASVQYHANPPRDDIVSGWHAIVASRDDGSFRIAVPPGRGHLLVYGPTSDYILDEIGSNTLNADRPGGARHRAHAIIAYDVKPEETPHDVVAELRPGRTIRGRALDPDGRPVAEASIMTRLDAGDTHTGWRYHVLHVRAGRFELHGLDLETSAPVIFFDAVHEQGTTVEVSGRQSGEELTVRLQPNGRARARFVGPDGRPIPGFNLGFAFEILFTPGPPNLGLKKEDRSRRLADAADLVNIDRRNYLDFPRADAEGRVTLPNLVPGATYRICDRSTMDVPDKGVQVRRDFTVKAGQTIDLGDVLIEKP